MRANLSTASRTGLAVALIVPLTASALAENFKAKAEFKDCDSCPTMVVLPPGSFTMGSQKNETINHDEEPRHDVIFNRPFAVGKFHVTVYQFETFVNATGYDAGSSCWVQEGGTWKEKKGYSWRRPGYPQTGDHPVACVNWNDAMAYAAWVSQQTGKRYRLLTEAEWEYAARGQTTSGDYPKYFFGESVVDMCRYGNVADRSLKNETGDDDNSRYLDCSDGAVYTSPVGSYSANDFGLYDMHGNLPQWVADCYHDSYKGAPKDGSAWISGNCRLRVLRGDSWNSNPGSLIDASRGKGTPEVRGVAGFRLARTLNP